MSMRKQFHSHKVNVFAQTAHLERSLGAMTQSQAHNKTREFMFAEFVCNDDPNHVTSIQGDMERLRAHLCTLTILFLSNSLRV
jgi:hypothetical protein